MTEDADSATGDDSEEKRPPDEGRADGTEGTDGDGAGGDGAGEATPLEDEFLGPDEDEDPQVVDAFPSETDDDALDALNRDGPGTTAAGDDDSGDRAGRDPADGTEDDDEAAGEAPAGRTAEEGAAPGADHDADPGREAGSVPDAVDDGTDEADGRTDAAEDGTDAAEDATSGGTRGAGDGAPEGPAGSEGGAATLAAEDLPADRGLVEQVAVYDEELAAEVESRIGTDAPGADAADEDPATELTDREGRIEDLEEALGRREQRISELEEMLETRQQELDGLESDVEDLETELAVREDDVEDLEEKLKRKQADFQNYKKRRKRKEEEIRERATEDLVERLVDVRDNLVRALDAEADTVEDLLGGVEMTLKEFDRVLEEEGVEEIAPAPGSDVDPQRHEVMLRTESHEPDGTVAEVYQPGYEMAERVLRSARVTVSEGTPEQPPGSDDGDDGTGGEDQQTTPEEGPAEREAPDEQAPGTPDDDAGAADGEAATQEDGAEGSTADRDGPDL